MSKTGQGPTRYDLPYATTKDIIQSTHRAKPELVDLCDSLVIAEDVQDALQVSVCLGQRKSDFYSRPKNA